MFNIVFKNLIFILLYFKLFFMFYLNDKGYCGKKLILSCLFLTQSPPQGDMIDLFYLTDSQNNGLR